MHIDAWGSFNFKHIYYCAPQGVLIHSQTCQNRIAVFSRFIHSRRLSLGTTGMSLRGCNHVNESNFIDKLENVWMMSPLFVSANKHVLHLHSENRTSDVHALKGHHFKYIVQCMRTGNKGSGNLSPNILSAGAHALPNYKYNFPSHLNYYTKPLPSKRFLVRLFMLTALVSVYHHSFSECGALYPYFLRE